MLLVDPTQRPNVNSIYGELSDLATARNVDTSGSIIFNDDIKRRLRSSASRNSGAFLFFQALVNIIHFWYHIFVYFLPFHIITEFMVIFPLHTHTLEVCCPQIFTISRGIAIVIFSRNLTFWKRLYFCSIFTSLHAYCVTHIASLFAIYFSSLGQLVIYFMKCRMQPRIRCHRRMYKQVSCKKNSLSLGVRQGLIVCSRCEFAIGGKVYWCTLRQDY